MASIKYYNMLVNFSLVLLICSTFLLAKPTLYVLAYMLIFVLVSSRILLLKSKKRVKSTVVFALFSLMVFQIAFVHLTFAQPEISIWMRAGYSLITVLPFIAERYITVNRYASFYLPAVSELMVFSFSEIIYYKSLLKKRVTSVAEAQESLSYKNFLEIAQDLPRHNFFDYISSGSLTEEYFRMAYDSLSDANIYIVISDTGSAASKVISAFTHDKFNHASLAFDYDLKTIISYNGGERIYPPGLNHEMISYFAKKEDSSILVYRLPCTVQEKRKIIDKVFEINGEGSAYNMLGLMLKYSHKPNILFCSQFVYKMLEYAGLKYFDKKDGEVKPCDFIALDYYRKLDFAYEIKFSE